MKTRAAITIPGAAGVVADPRRVDRLARPTAVATIQIIVIITIIIIRIIPTIAAAVVPMVTVIILPNPMGMDFR